MEHENAVDVDLAWMGEVTTVSSDHAVKMSRYCWMAWPRATKRPYEIDGLFSCCAGLVGVFLPTSCDGLKWFKLGALKFERRFRYLGGHGFLIITFCGSASHNKEKIPIVLRQFTCIACKVVLKSTDPLLPVLHTRRNT